MRAKRQRHCSDSQKHDARANYSLCARAAAEASVFLQVTEWCEIGCVLPETIRLLYMQQSETKPRLKPTHRP